jgi:branched-subunit amino acid ABC-type transport system permease component
MKDFLAYTVLGLALGSVYAIAASGLVVTYTTSGIFNFAHGAIGMFCAVCYWQVHVDWGVTTWLSLLIVIGLIAPAIGVFLEVVVMRGLQGTSEVTKLVVPIAVLLAIDGLAVWIWFDDPDKVRQVSYFFGIDHHVDVFGQPLYWHNIIGVAAAVLLAVVLRLVLYRTQLGVTMRAVVDDRSLVQLNGGRPDRAAMASWAIGAMTAAVAGILLAPVLDLQVLALTLLVVDAYAAAIFGRLRSLPWTFAGALILGLAKTYWDWLSQGGQRWLFLQNFRNAVPAIVLFLVLLALPQERLRGAVVSRTRERFNVPTVRQAVAWGAVLIAGMAMLQALISAPDIITVQTGISASIMALSLVLLTGYAGEINLAVYSFAGIATIVAWQIDVGPGGNALKAHLSVVAIVVAMLVTAIVGGIVALPALRLRGLYLGLATFAFAVFVQQMVLQQSQQLTFHQLGLKFHVDLFSGGTLTVPRPNWFGVDFLLSNRNYLMLLTVVFALVGVFLITLRRSAYGRALSAMKDSPAACATLGLNVTRLKLSVFMLSAAIAGLGGVLYSAQLRTVNGANDYVVFLSLALFMLVVVGGVGYVSGALLAGIFAWVSFTVVGNVFDKLSANYPSFEPIFHFFGKFSTLLGAALAGIALGRNPTGVAQQIMDGFRPLRKAPAAVGVWIAGEIVLWAFALNRTLPRWWFVIITIAGALIVPRVIMLVHPDRFREELHLPPPGEDDTPPELVGIARPFTSADLATMERALDLPETVTAGD